MTTTRPQERHAVRKPPAGPIDRTLPISLSPRLGEQRSQATSRCPKLTGQAGQSHLSPSRRAQYPLLPSQAQRNTGRETF